MKLKSHEEHKTRGEGGSGGRGVGAGGGVLEGRPELAGPAALTIFTDPHTGQENLPAPGTSNWLRQEPHQTIIRPFLLLRRRLRRLTLDTTLREPIQNRCPGWSIRNHVNRRSVRGCIRPQGRNRQPPFVRDAIDSVDPAPGDRTPPTPQSGGFHLPRVGDVHPFQFGWQCTNPHSRPGRDFLRSRELFRNCQRTSGTINSNMASTIKTGAIFRDDGKRSERRCRRQALVARAPGDRPGWTGGMPGRRKATPNS